MNTNHTTAASATATATASGRNGGRPGSLLDLDLCCPGCGYDPAGGACPLCSPEPEPLHDAHVRVAGIFLWVRHEEQALLLAPQAEVTEWEHHQRRYHLLEAEAWIERLRAVGGLP